MKTTSSAFDSIIDGSVYKLTPRAEIWRKDLESGVDELRASNLIIQTLSYDEILDDGIVKASINLSFYDPIGSLFPYTLDSPTTFLGNRIIVYLDITSAGTLSNNSASFKLGEFYIQDSPDGAIPLPWMDSRGAWHHEGGSVKITAVDKLSDVGKEIRILPLRAKSQSSVAALQRIFLDSDWGSRGLVVNYDGIAWAEVEFEESTDENDPWGTVYPEALSDQVRLVVEQSGHIAYADQNGVIKFRKAGDQPYLMDCTPRARLIKQNIKQEYRDLFNAVLVEDVDSEIDGNQRAFYRLESNPLLRFGRFRRMIKKFSVEDVPNQSVALEKINTAINQAGKLDISMALQPNLSAGDQVLVNPRIGEVPDIAATILELNHDFEEGTTDIKVGLLSESMADCPNLGLTHEIVNGEFVRKV